MTALGTGAGFRQTSGPRTVHVKQIAPVPNAVLRQAKDASWYNYIVPIAHEAPIPDALCTWSGPGR